jgi:hypothetical protein
MRMSHSSVTWTSQALFKRGAKRSADPPRVAAPVPLALPVPWGEPNVARETEQAQVRAKAAGLAPWFRARLLNGLNRLFLVLLIPGGLLIAETPPPNRLLVLILCVSIFGAVALGMSLHTALVLRQLRRDPEKAVARLTKRRTLKRAGFTPVSW